MTASMAVVGRDDASIRRLAAARRVALVAGVAGMGIGAAALAGWILGLPVLSSFIPNAPTMKANGAIAWIALSGSLVVGLRWPGRVLLRDVLALVAIAIVAATLVEHGTGTAFGIDELLVDDPSAMNGRMTAGTAIGVLLEGIGGLALWRRGWAALGFATRSVAIGLGIVAIAGYVYDVADLYEFGFFDAASLASAIALVVVGIGQQLAVPTNLVERALESGPGGALIRRLWLATIVLPIVLGFVVLLGIRADLYGTSLGVALLALGLTGILLLIVVRTAVAIDAEERRRRATEASARQAADRERLVMANVTDAIVTIGQDSTIIYANPAADRLFGYAAGGLLGRSLTDLMPESFRDRHLAGLHRYLDTGQRHISWEGTELTGLRADGEEFPIEVSFAESSIDGERAFNGIIRDVSARKVLEGRLGASQRLESIGRLAGGIAHDFNNILTAMLGANQILLDDLARDDPLRDEAVAIDEGGQRAATLIRQLLAFSRQQVLQPERISLAHVLRGLTPMLARLLGSTVRIATGRLDEDTIVHADRGQLEQVIVNLAVNARDAMPGGGRITFDARTVELAASDIASAPELGPGRYAELTVRDTGMGMDVATQQRIFEPFFTTKSEGLGTGLGLATVFGIVKQSGGHVWVSSVVGRGSTFRIVLPLADREAVANAAPDLAPATTPAETDVSRSPAARATSLASTDGERILVVEDEPMVRDLVAMILARAGFEPIVVADGAEALRRFEELEPEPVVAVLTDVVLPGMSGIDLAGQLKRRDPRMAVILMSGHSSDEFDAAMIEQPTLEFIAKPFAAASVVEAVRRAIERSRAGS